MLARLTAIVLGLAHAHGHHDDVRLRQVAQDIWTASGEQPSYCGEGDAAQYATALGLTAIAVHESALDKRVQDCTWWAGNPAVSLFQLQGPVALDGHSRRDVCASNALASSLAAKAFGRYQRCGDIGCQSRGYASGNTTVHSKAAREIAAQIATLQWRERIFVSYKEGCLHAAYVKD